MSYRRIHSTEYAIVRVFMLLNIWWIGCKEYKNPLKALRVVLKMLHTFKQMIGNDRLVRAFKTNGKYIWDIYNPAWPSKGFDAFFKGHLHETQAISKNHSSLRRLLVAITKRCPLSCEHCSEGATLYKDDVLTYSEFISRIDSFVEQGVGQLVYSGGEPLSRFEDLLKFISHYKNRCDQWIYTSAFGLTAEKAKLLKQAGLNGAAISLDHHLEEEHNRFRGNKRSFQWVMEGIKHLQEAGVFVAINVCPTRQYIDSGGMENLIRLAENLNVPVINILEPRAVGNYQDKLVELTSVHKAHLLELSKRYNFNKAVFNSPSVIYPASFRGVMPCGGGRSYLLLDYDGTLYPCPFCKVKMRVPIGNEPLCEAV